MVLRSVVLVCSLFAASLTYAQESATNIAEAPNLAPPTQTSAANASAAKSPWHLSLGTENYTYELDQRTYGSKAATMSLNFVGGVYDINSTWSAELRQHFQFASSTDNLGGRDRALHRNNWETSETMIRAIAKPQWLAFEMGAKSMVFDVRYYAPNDHVAQDNKELGRLRSDTFAEWFMGPKFSIAGWISPRVQLNSSSNPNANKGADAEYYQLKAAPYLNYYINDNIAPYYGYTFVGKSSEAQRGQWTPDMTNVGAHEAGLNLYYGAFYINTALISETDLNNGAGSLLTNDSRAFAYDNLSYNLNIYATF
ncbi:hypothetical protein D3C72_1340800 [compost metagenome]